MPETPSATTLLRGKEVARRVGRHLSTLWVWARRGEFPVPVVLNPNSRRKVVGWRESDVEAWLNSPPQRPAAPISERAYATRRTKKAGKEPVKPRVVLRRPTS
jgi:predicted DNA-binding transcriptional regulator AlpA